MGRTGEDTAGLFEQAVADYVAAAQQHLALLALG